MIMINSCFELHQDTVPGKIFSIHDSARIKPDSLSFIKAVQIKDTSHHKQITINNITALDYSDTIDVCERNSISDITFYDSTNFVSNINSGSVTRFPYIFVEKTRQQQADVKASLVKHLKPGSNIAIQPLHNDWVILIILLSVFLFSFIKTSSKSILPGVTWFFLFRGINDPTSKEMGRLFHWQSTLLNFISFMIIGLFCYYAALYYDFVPANISGILFWLISLGVVVSAITLRHIVCLITGKISGQKELFSEYLLGVYQSYRFSALFFFVFIILLSYTVFFSAKVCFISGIIVIGIMYLFRITRLLIIILNRNISIFYLILYLCALEILPVLITVKYFTDLV
jgi:hypothetical protein